MNIINDCKKFLGLAPYNDWTNIVVGDGHYLNSLNNKYGKDNVDKTMRELSGS